MVRLYFSKKDIRALGRPKWLFFEVVTEKPFLAYLSSKNSNNSKGYRITRWTRYVDVSDLSGTYTTSIDKTSNELRLVVNKISPYA